MYRVKVQALQLPEHPPRGVAAFAIDSPRVGDIADGQGVEITGWVIGKHEAVQGVRTLVGARRSRVYPLDVSRPDVAADYPAFAHASPSGFTAWAPIDFDADDREFTVEAVLGNGTTTTLGVASVAALLVLRSEPPIGEFPVHAPDFVIIGTQRGGTTSLHAYLSAHPQVKTPATKELHFFTDRYERGLDWYLGQFSFTLRYYGVRELAGEATPYALFHPLAPERLRQTAPHAKLIALLRNPVDRAYSHYLLERSRGFEPLDFAAALDAEAERLAGEEARIASDPAYVGEAHKHFSYLARGDYAPQLERWFAQVPCEQMLVLRSEDLYERPAATFAQVAAFLSITPRLDAPFAAHNRSTGPPLDTAVRDRLTAHFAPKNARLAELLGWNPGWG